MECILSGATYFFGQNLLTAVDERKTFLDGLALAGSKSFNSGK